MNNISLKSGPGSIELRRSAAPVVKANQLLYAHFERPDLEAAEHYLLDFGLLRAARTENELFMRGTGRAPYIYRITRDQSRAFSGWAFRCRRPKISTNSPA